MILGALQERGSEDQVINWVLRIGVAGFFVLVGLDKFSQDPRSEWVGIFQRIGFGVWFRYCTGLLEVGGGLLYLWPAATGIGAGLLVCTMTGAIVAHLTVLHDPGSSVIPLALGIGAALAALRVRRAV